MGCPGTEFYKYVVCLETGLKQILKLGYNGFSLALDHFKHGLYSLARLKKCKRQITIKGDELYLK